MATLTKGPAASKQKEAQVDIEADVRTALIAAVAELQPMLKKADLEMAVTVAHPKTTADFYIRHVSDDHIIGFFRAFAFTPITGTGFGIRLHWHIDETDEHIALEERSLLQNKKEQQAFRENVMAFITKCVKDWSA